MDWSPGPNKKEKAIRTQALIIKSFLCVHLLVCMSVCMLLLHSCGTHGGQKRASYSLELKLHMLEADMSQPV